MTITKELEWDMGHRVPGQMKSGKPGPCSSPHGHRYRLEVGVAGEVIGTSGDPQEGMVIDFTDLKMIMMQEVHERFDHGYMIYEHDEYLPYFQPILSAGKKIIIVPFIPTAENIAKHIYNLIQPKLLEKNIQLKYVRIWETPTSTAVWEG